MVFVLSAMVVLVVGFCGFLLYTAARDSLDDELGKKLIAVAGAVTAQIDGEGVIQLRPGDEGSRTYRNIRQKLMRIRFNTDVKRIYFFDLNLLSLVETDEGVPIGIDYPKLRFDEVELRAVRKGIPAASVLFKGVDGLFYKSGYWPVFVNGEVMAVLGVDASATFLASIRSIRRNLFIIGIISVLAAVLIAVLFSKTIVNPIKRLVVAAKEIGAGNYQKPISVKSGGEIGFLAETLDDMKDNILRRDHQQKTMLAGVAHEIRNPLGGIEIFANLISDESGEDQEQRERAQKILKEVKNLKGIINEFLDYARPSKPDPKHCVMSDVMAEVRAVISHDLEKTRVKIDLQELGGNSTIFVDPRQLQQVFLNLIKNSIQAMPDGGLITIRTVPNREWMVIDFEDTGKGISDDLMHKLFDPFFTTHEQGTGLGLAMVKKLVEDNGGRIGAQRLKSGGLKFSIWLPRNNKIR